MDFGFLGRRQLILGGMLIFAGSVAFASRLRSGMSEKFSDREFRKLMPDSVGNFKYFGDDGLILPEEEESKLVYSNMRSGVYNNENGNAIMVLLGYDGNEDRSNTLHRPESCYEGSGLSISDRSIVVIIYNRNLNIKCTSWVASNESRNEIVLYFTRIGKFFPNSYLEQNISTIKSGIEYGRYDSILARFSTVSSDVDNSRKLLISFANQFINSLDTFGTRIVLGAT